MLRKDQQLSPSRLIPFKGSNASIEKRESERQELVVNVKVGQRPPLSLKVPKNCNMKILKSMILFNVKRSVPATDSNKIVGFESEQKNYQLDYRLQNGIGELGQSLVLTSLAKAPSAYRNTILNYKICRMISIGGFSKVYLLRDLSTGSFCAGKFMSKQVVSTDMVLNEYNLSSNISHPYVIKTHKLLETEHFYIFILDFYPGGELFQLLKQNRHMREEKARFYIVEVLLALKYLHEKSIAFRDIKPQNILLDQKGHLKLVDFGLAKKVSTKSYSFCGSLDYMAPEIMKDEGHSLEVDYYAVGNLLFQILVGSPPFYHPRFTHDETKYHILNTEVKFPVYLKLSTTVTDLMTRLLAKEPTERLGFVGGIEEILSHQWFSNISIADFMNKAVTPPIFPQILLPSYIEEDSRANKVWNNLMDKDIRQEELRQSIQSPKAMNGIRHRSLNSQKSCDEKENNGYKNGKQAKKGKEGNKMQTTMSLLYVLTHKRVTSECPTPKPIQLKDYNKPKISHLRSMNLSRKSSLYCSQGKLKLGRSEGLTGEEKLMIVCGLGKKEEKIKKRKKYSEAFLKVKSRC